MVHWYMDVCAVWLVHVVQLEQGHVHPLPDEKSAGSIGSKAVVLRDATVASMLSNEKVGDNQ